MIKPIYYTAVKINGDYASLVTDDGVENIVAMALLPDEIDVGDRVLCENLEYSIVKK